MNIIVVIRCPICNTSQQINIFDTFFVFNRERGVNIPYKCSKCETNYALNLQIDSNIIISKNKEKK